MQLLNLINGFPGAPSGTAEVFVSGSTASLATVYADAAGAATLTNPVVLDANGSATAYVDTTVDIVIKTSTGAIAKARYTPEGVDAMIETSGPSFTGANPVTGALAVNQPIGLDTVLDRWVASAGAPDWRVRRTGQAADETLKAAFAAISSGVAPFFNVRSYGALGDGATDDAAAFDLAVAAAVAAGGGIVFVPGTLTSYLLSRTISVASPKVSFLGVGALASVLSSTTALPALSWTGGVTTQTGAFCMGIGFTGTSALNTASVSLSSVPGFSIINCRGSVTAPTSAANGVFNVTCRANITNCSFANPAAAVHGVYVSPASLGTVIRDCVLEASSGIQFLVRQADQLTMDNCRHVSGATSTILMQCSGSPGTTMTRIVNCHALTGKWIYNNGSNGPIVEDNNTFADAVSTTGTNVGGVSNLGNASTPNTRLGSRQATTGSVSISPGGSYSPRGEIVTHDLTMTIALTVGAPLGQFADGDDLVFIIFNNTAGALNVTWNATYNVSATPTSVAAAQRCRIEFRQVVGVWRALAAAVVFT